jgi:hypothetical protein
MRYPFEVSFAELQAELEEFVSTVFSSLESEFLVIPKGEGFIEYPVFEQAYESLKQSTKGFESFSPESVYEAFRRKPLSLIVIRAMLGFTPSEWAYLATRRTGTEVTQGFVRTLDRNIRLSPEELSRMTPTTEKRVAALVTTACELLCSTPPSVGQDKVHRLEKADTRGGLETVRAMAALGAPYAMLLYERFLGRPFAGHRDSVSELVGDVLESVIERVLGDAGIHPRKTKRAEKVAGFDQAPDFIVPDEFNPQVVIEAKLTEDDGTARDKVTRVQHLAALSKAGGLEDPPRFEVVACIAGRGFGIRREDMKKLLLATRGKVFTLRTLGSLVLHTRLREFRTK